MSEPKIGKIHERPQGRDAVHVALAPVIAAERLRPGVAVMLEPDSAERVVFASPGQAIGIIDPFLTVDAIEPEQRCFVFLNPGTITGLRHVWLHPKFPPLEGQALQAFEAETLAEAWLRSFADRAGLSYDALLEHLDNFVYEGERAKDTNLGWDDDALMIFRHDVPGFIHKERPEMWANYKTLRHREIPEKVERVAPFSCNCS